MSGLDFEAWFLLAYTGYVVVSLLALLWVGRGSLWDIPPLRWLLARIFRESHAGRDDNGRRDLRSLDHRGRRVQDQSSH